MAWGRVNKWGMKPTSARGPVIWVDRTSAKPAPFARAIPEYAGDSEKHVSKELIDNLQPGALFVATCPLGVLQEQLQNQFPALGIYHKRRHNEVFVLPAGGFLLYAGPVHVDEICRKGRIVTAQRHTFVVGTVRYVVANFACVKPA